jgi:ABC-2 type transport system permease protein
VIGSFAYLIVRSARNRLLSQLRRVRNPRYALAVALGLAYFWFVLLRSRMRAGAPAPAPGEALRILVPLGVLLLTAWTWIFGADRTALAFTEAEVSMLFTAPVSRRALIVYKLARSQSAVLVTSVLWTVVFRRGGFGLDALARALGFWVLLSTLSFHRLGVALIRASQAEHGIRGLRRSWISVTAFALIVAAVARALVVARQQFAVAADGPELLRALAATLGTPPASWVMYPFRVALAPTFASPGAEWARAMIPALALLLLHVWWVLRMDAAFEEAAVEASAVQARRVAALRTRRAGGSVALPANAKRTLRLDATGAPAVAILWKNYLWLLRTGQLRGIVGPPLIAMICVAAFAGRSNTAELAIALLCIVLLGIMIIFGPMMVRNDLRSELLHLPMLNTFPLRGQQIVLAEVASSAPPVAAMQFFLLAAACVALSFTTDVQIPGAIRVSVLVGAPLLLLGLNAVSFTIHNGMALLFPAWVKLGDSGARLEAIGQSMLTSSATLLLLLLLLVVPGVAGGTALLLLRGQQLVAGGVAGATAGVLLGMEAWVMIGMLGGALERTEPEHVG